MTEQLSSRKKQKPIADEVTNTRNRTVYAVF